MERKCKDCKIMKLLEDFPEYVAKGKRGYRHVCKDCWNKKWGPVWKEHINRYYHTNQSGIRDKAKERMSIAYYKDKQKTYERNEIYRERHPEKWEAHLMARKAIRSGELIRQPCEVCGNPKTDAHHDDYSKPLDVRWLCRFHHGENHRQMNREGMG